MTDGHECRQDTRSLFDWELWPFDDPSTVVKADYLAQPRGCGERVTVVRDQKMSSGAFNACGKRCLPFAFASVRGRDNFEYL